MTRLFWLDQPVSDVASCGLTQVPRSIFSRLSPGSQAGAFARIAKDAGLGSCQRRLS